MRRLNCVACVCYAFPLYQPSASILRNAVRYIGYVIRKEMSMENTVKAYCNNLPQLLNRRQFSKEELALFGFGEDVYEKRKKRSEQQK